MRKQCTSIIVKAAEEAKIDNLVGKAIDKMQKEGWTYIGFHTSKVLDNNFKFKEWECQIVFNR